MLTLYLRKPRVSMAGIGPGVRVAEGAAGRLAGSAAAIRQCHHGLGAGGQFELKVGSLGTQGVVLQAKLRSMLKQSTRRVIKFYNGRGTAERWIKEVKNAVKWTRLSCRRFKRNQARPKPFAFAYNLGNFLRQLALPRSVRRLPMTTLREKPIKIGAKVFHHARAVTFKLADVEVPRESFAATLDRIGRLTAVPQTVYGPLWADE
jgi:hypothetical protein